MYGEEFVLNPEDTEIERLLETAQSQAAGAAGAADANPALVEAGDDTIAEPNEGDDEDEQDEVLEDVPVEDMEDVGMSDEEADEGEEAFFEDEGYEHDAAEGEGEG